MNLRMVFSRLSASWLLPVRPGRRWYSEGTTGDAGERHISAILKEKFPKATTVIVEDISGGCGSMYAINIESSEFAGMRKVKQHMMVNEALEAEIKDMHGLRINTQIPES